ncbi:hypothetical protein HMPREF1544_02374 [Mucor circinelloides 1006PhL]|uniref:Uncharacterized protein n=1 Tax=Mucor circinelloides f. circinelloides (strain 1006PhL) TaxID=1220926 RepID=S2JKC4_MUCC1|nr:hypothetical protein HMPREF1544_02374 [Mucor circinelloides 1006PhL]
MGSFAYDAYGCIISIDFGTTFSGSCYATIFDEETKDLNIINNDTKYIQTAYLEQDEIINIEDWNESKGNKTPTVVVYDEHMHLSHWGKAATKHIATKKGPHDIVLEKFKLKLPKSVSQKGAALVSGNTEQDDEEANMRATIDFFRVVYDHIFNQIHAHRPVNDIEFTKDDIRFVITVPAIWNDVERTIMRNVAISAGLISEKDHESRLIIINESLAATLYCERERGKNKIEVGTNYIICDAGGGTVDIASFVATDPLEENKSFPRCQLTADTGERCGSTYLDERMKELLMRVLFRPNDKKIYYSDKQREEFGKLGFIDYSADEKKEIDVIVAELLKQFNEDGGSKYEFPAPISCESTDQEPAAESSSDGDSESDDGSEQDNYHSSGETSEEEEEEEELNEQKEDEKVKDDPYQQKNATIFRITARAAIEKIRFQPVSEATYVKDPNSKIGVRLLVISYATMRELVFDPIIHTTIKLLEKQIEKIKDPIVATFLVGGFGRNPYLHYKIKDNFKIEENGRIVGYKCGTLYDDEKGNLAAMRGALYYGLDGSRKPTQTDIIESSYDGVQDASGTHHDGFVPENYDMIICYDIGYDFTSCSYLDLSDENNEGDQKFVLIDEWPGAAEKTTRIPTAFRSASEWGAQVSNPTDAKPEEFVVPSKLMSIVKGDFRRFLANLISAMQDHVCSFIEKNGRSVNPDKIRYCITMENSYRFFFRKSEMRQVAVKAGLISNEDSTKRLLLIKREDAAAMHFEEEHFRPEGKEKKAFSSKFLQIFFHRDTCHLSLQEATKLSGYNDKRKAILEEARQKSAESKNKDNDSPETKGNEESVKEKYFRNVRGVRSATLPFSFIQKLILNLKAYVDKNLQNCINCSNLALSNEHETSYDAFSADFRDGFLAYIKTELDFSSNEHIQKISIRKEGCCEVYISVYDLLENVFRPAIRDLVGDISRYSTQVDIINFRLDKIFLIGKLVEAKEATYSFLERVIAKSISEVLNIGNDFITTSDKIKAENHILGAQIYAKDPTTYTERVARKTYVIGIKSYTVQKFRDDIRKQIKELEDEDKDNKDKIYDLEAEFALRDEDGPELYYQPEFNPSLKVPKGPEDATLLIARGRKMLEQDQVAGIERKFFAHEECLVYASVYVTEEYHPDDKLETTKLDKYQRIHQFEIYLKKDKDDPMANFKDNRLHFSVRMIPDNNEVIFEASVSSRIGRKIPEFRFRDEILVAQIYNDVDRIPYFESQRKEDKEQQVDK